MILLHEEKLYVRKDETLKIDKIKKKSFIYRKLLLFLQKIQTMANRDYKLMLLEDAEQFLASLPENVRFKITYNIRRVLAGEINKREGHYHHCDPWYCQKDTKDSTQRNS